MLRVMGSVFRGLLCMQTNISVLVHHHTTVTEAATKVATVMTSEAAKRHQRIDC